MKEVHFMYLKLFQDSSGDKNDSDSDDEAPPKKNKNALPDDDDVPRDDL